MLQTTLKKLATVVRPLPNQDIHQDADQRTVEIDNSSLSKGWHANVFAQIAATIACTLDHAAVSDLE